MCVATVTKRLLFFPLGFEVKTNGSVQGVPAQTDSWLTAFFDEWKEISQKCALK
jgi:hypothetical protein